MPRRITLSLVGLSALILPHVAMAEIQSFSDVPVGHPNAEAIAYMKERGIVEGYPDGTFRPDATINRAEFVAILMRAYFYSPPDFHGERGLSFFDTNSEEWYANWLYQAIDYGIIDGYPDNTFRPAATINFAEAAKIIVLSNTFGKNDEALDSHESHPWFQRYVRYLAEKLAIPTSILRFDQAITRGEMAEMIYRLKTKDTELPSTTYEQLTREMPFTPSDFEGETVPLNGWTTYKHVDPHFTFSYPKDWEVFEDRGDLDIYIQRKNAPFSDIVLSYCGPQCFERPTEECMAVMPILGVKGCRVTYADDREQWTFVVRIGETELHVMANSTEKDMPELLAILRTILASLR